MSRAIPQPSSLGVDGRLLTTLTSPVRDAVELRQLAASCSDWEHMLRMAKANRVDHQLALVLKSLTATGHLPVSIHHRLDHLARRAFVLDQVKIASLAEVASDFDSAAVPLILLKGCGLADRLYAEPTERSFSDLDLLVPRDLVAEAGRRLERLGYTPVREEYYQSKHFHVPYHRQCGSRVTIVELHWDVVKPDSIVRFEMERWWHGAYRVKVRGIPLLLPPLVEELGYLSHHAFLAGAVTLRSLQDIARWVLRYDAELDWEEAAARARSNGVDHFVREALELCRLLWDTRASGLERFQPAPLFRRWLARNLVTPSTVVRAGDGTWWPFRHVCYWSMLDSSGGSPRALVSRVLRGNRFMDAANVVPLLGRGSRLLSLAMALALCLLPSSYFPISFRERRAKEIS